MCVLCLYVLCCPAKLLALIKTESCKISRDLFVSTWCIGLIGFRKDCLCHQRRRKQHANTAPHRAYRWLVAFVCGFVFLFFLLQKNCHLGL